MADEAKLIIEYLPPVSFTVANATGIEKGALLKMTTGMTAIAVAAGDGVGLPFAGVAGSEKIASDGNPMLGLYRQGVFRMTASGSIAVGDPVCLTNGAAPNRVEKAATNEEDLVGTALDTVTDGELLRVELNPRGVSLA